MGKVTIKMIADSLGISISTVNRALINKGRISEETRRRVLEAANEMGYRPNAQAKALSSKEPLRIAVICSLDQYQVKVVDGIEAYRREREGFRIELVYKWRENLTVEEQRTALLDCLKENINGVLISALHPTILNDAVAKLAACGIPTITFNNDMKGSERLAYVGQNGQVAGMMAGELMSQCLKPGDAVVCLVSDDISMGLKERADFFCTTVASTNTGLELCGLFVFDHTQGIKAADDAALEILRTKKIRGIYANNMDGTLGIAHAIDKLGLQGQIVAIGHDSSPEINEFISSGALRISLFQNPFRQGYQSLRLMFEYLYLKKEIKDTQFYIPTVVLMRSNLEESESPLF